MAGIFELELPTYSEPTVYMEDTRGLSVDTYEEVIDLTEEIVEANHGKVGKNDFNILKIIGKGGYGTVFLVQKVTGKDRGSYLAMKMLKKSAIVKNQKDTAHTKTERNILEAVKHPFIVELYYAFQTEGNLYLIMEFLNGGELFKCLDREGFLLNDDARFYVCEITLALQHLHSLDIIYRDLKPENVLLDAAGHIKLADFGLCKQNINEESKTHTFCGTVEYMAPEILNRTGHGKAADWWSLGALLYDMLTGKSPFTPRDGPENRKNTIHAILHNKLYFPKYFDPVAKTFVRSLLTRCTSSRLGTGRNGSEAVKAHEYFRHINWTDVINKKLKPPYVPKLTGGDDVSQFDRKFTQQQIPAESPVTSSPLDFQPFQGFSFVAQCVMDQSRNDDSSLERSTRRMNIGSERRRYDDDDENMEVGGIDIPRSKRY